jgi:hypothetical protein
MKDKQEIFRLIMVNGEVIPGDVVVVDDEASSLSNRTIRARADHQSDQSALC